MARNSELEILGLKLLSLQERIELKKAELEELVEEYKEAYPRYLRLAVNASELEDKDRCCDNCKYATLNGDEHPCFTCKLRSNWEAK